MKRLGLVAGVLALALAPVVAAQTVEPAQTRTFDDVESGTALFDVYPDVTIGAGASCIDEVQDDPVEDDQAGRAACHPLSIGFSEPQAQVSLRVWTVTTSFTAFDPALVELRAISGESTVGVDSRVIAEDEWAPLTVATSDGTASIDSVVVSTDHSELAIDDLTYAATPQPDTAIVDGPSGVTASRDATFSVEASVSGSTIECSLDGAPFGACGPYTGLADGAHSLQARATDPYGNVDATPAERAWTIAQPAPPPPPPPGDPDGDGVPAAADNCPSAANPGQTDEDDDAIGNACEILPSGSLPPVAGIRTTVEAVAGQVFVRLPARTIVARAALQPPGFEPLKGVRPGGETPARFVPLEGIASIPVESTIDARKGQVAMTTDAAFDRGADNGARQAGRFAAAIFTIKQSRRRRAAAAGRSTTDLVLRTPPGSARACATASERPPKGIVRSFTGAVTGPAKGAFRAVGAASTTTVARATTWITQDRCNGTLTEVGRGRATVFDRVARTSVTVRAGQAYRARALLFAAKRRRAGR
jgi:hypothetical protein